MITRCRPVHQQIRPQTVDAPTASTTPATLLTFKTNTVGTQFARILFILFFFFFPNLKSANVSSFLKERKAGGKSSINNKKFSVFYLSICVIVLLAGGTGNR